VKDPYGTLGVNKSASADEIKSAYRKLAKQYHPDQHPNDKSAEAKFKEISAAYEILSDPGKKSNFDRFGSAEGGFGGFGGGSSGFSDFGGFDFGGAFSGFGDIFNSVFEGGFGDFMGGGRRQRANRGNDITVSVSLSFKESCLGVKKTVTFSRFEKCHDCNGTGAKHGTATSTCSYCNGNGRVRQSQRLGGMTFEQVVPCSACNASGQIIKEKCGACSGKGSNKKNVSYEVNIPAGIADGQILNIAGEGDAPTGGDGLSGALLIKVKVAQHPILIRSDYDLYLELPISFTQAILGDKVEIPTVEGRIEFTVPPYTQNGYTQRLRGKGIKKLRGIGSGDLIVKVIVEMPKSLDKKQVEAIRTLNGEVSPRAYEKRQKYNNAL